MNEYLIKFTVYDNNDNSFLFSDNCILHGRKLDECFVKIAKEHIKDKHIDENCYGDCDITIDNIIKLDD